MWVSVNIIHTESRDRGGRSGDGGEGGIEIVGGMEMGGGREIER